jgi:hypothetical protein
VVGENLFLVLSFGFPVRAELIGRRHLGREPETDLEALDFETLKL